MKKETVEETRKMLIREWKKLRGSEEYPVKLIIQFEQSSGIIIPSTHKVIRIMPKGQIVIKRPDGLTVFLDSSDDDSINYIRLHASKKYVILAIGLYRGLQISQNYKRKYADNLDTDYMKFMDNILQVVGKIKLITGGNDNENGNSK